MFFSTHLSSKRLAELCHRLAVGLEAGIDVRKVWQREAESATGTLKSHFGTVRDAVGQGESLSDALAQTGRLFPRLFLEMVNVGERTGQLPAVLRNLAGYYRHRADLRRKLLARMSWPLMQLSVALFVVGVLIYVMGAVIPQRGGKRIDLLGFGLFGTKGLIVYLNILVGLAIAGFLLYGFVKRNAAVRQRLLGWAMRVPGLGLNLQKLALARMAWAMHLVLNVEMDLRTSIPLVFRAADNDYFGRHADDVVADIIDGQPITAAFLRTRLFPADFIDAVEVGEQSGQLVESMGRLSRHYEDEAQEVMAALAVLLGFLIWGFVALLIIVLVFRIYGFYLGAIKDAANI